MTRIQYKTGLVTWLAAAGTCMVGCIPCCLIPFCMDVFKDVDHFCTKCDTFIGTKSRG